MDYLPGDLFAVVDGLLGKAPFGTEVSAGFIVNDGAFKDEDKDTTTIVEHFQIDVGLDKRLDKLNREQLREEELRNVRRVVSRLSVGSTSSWRSKSSARSNRSKSSARRSRSRSSARSDCSVRTSDLNSADSVYSLRESLFDDSNPLIDNRSRCSTVSAPDTSLLFPLCRRISPERSSSTTSGLGTEPMLSDRHGYTNMKIKEALKKACDMAEGKKRKSKSRKGAKESRTYGSFDGRQVVAPDHPVDIDTDLFDFTGSNLQESNDCSAADTSCSFR